MNKEQIQQSAEKEYPKNPEAIRDFRAPERMAFVKGYTAALQAKEQGSDWIKVEDALPELNEDCLCLTVEKKVRVCEYDGIGFIPSLNTELHWSLYFVSHWQPLPEPPKQ